MKIYQKQLKIAYIQAAILCFSSIFSSATTLIIGIGFLLLGYKENKLRNYTSISLQVPIL